VTPAERHLLKQGDQIGGAVGRSGQDDPDEPGVRQVRLQRRVLDAAVAVFFSHSTARSASARRQQAGANWRVQFIGGALPVVDITTPEGSVPSCVLQRDGSARVAP